VFHIAEQLWLSLDPLPQLVPLFGMHFLLLYSLLFFLAVFHLNLSLSKPIFSHGALHTGSASERFTPLEALYKSLNTKQNEHLFSISQDCSLLSGSLTLEALLIGVHCKKCYIN